MRRAAADLHGMEWPSVFLGEPPGGTAVDTPVGEHFREGITAMLLLTVLAQAIRTAVRVLQLGPRPDAPSRSGSP
jgi:hypothetical protein